MKVTEEFVYWSDESTLNFDAMWGTYPRLQRSKPMRYTILYYCYYEPQYGETQASKCHVITTVLTYLYNMAKLKLVCVMLLQLFLHIFTIWLNSS